MGFSSSGSKANETMLGMFVFKFCNLNQYDIVLNS